MLLVADAKLVGQLLFSRNGFALFVWLLFPPGV
jgi:hypothetical protein